jgi:uncharacterized protein YfiM (DUF2279 family)
MASHDRIAEPWGARTPYGPGESWPVRVDSNLGSGISPEHIDRWVQSASLLHFNGDAMDIAVSGGRIVGVRGRAVDRVNHGRLDPKDLFGWRASNSPDRLTVPLIRKGDRLVEATGTLPWIWSPGAAANCSPRRAPARWRSTPRGSCSWRSTTP